MAVRSPRLPGTQRLLCALPMRPWTSIISALLLVLMLWTGAAGHAAERVACSPATAESSAHIGSNDDSRSDDRDGKTGHYHMGCNGNCVATPADRKALSFYGAPRVTTFDRQASWHAGDGPTLTLRPPIA